LVEAILSYLWTAALSGLIQIGIFIVPGLILAFIINYESAFVQKRALMALGRGWYLGLFGWLGTMVHEIGHAFFCLIFLHKITAIKLFQPDTKTGTLGYVKHSYNPKSLYQVIGNFFIGVGPIVFGTVVIYLLSYLLLGLNPFELVVKLNLGSSSIYSWDALMQIVRVLWSSSVNLLGEVFSGPNFSSWQLYVFIYLVFAIGTSITLSPPDIKGALKGFIVILILIFIFNLATVWMGNFTTNLITVSIGFLVFFYTAVFLILLLNIAFSLLLLLPLSLLGKRR
jgi:hypothetical protein